MDDFYRIKRLPPYVFAIVNDLKTKARARGGKISGRARSVLPGPRGTGAYLTQTT